MKGTSIPVYYYTFAEGEFDAKLKVEMKWGEYDPKTTVKEITESEIKDLVIATNNFG